MYTFATFHVLLVLVFNMTRFGINADVAVITKVNSSTILKRTLCTKYSPLIEGFFYKTVELLSVTEFYVHSINL